jgi:two-component system phosphate regulon sensor histidine kinase PhoR
MPKTLKRFVIGYLLLHLVATLLFVWVIARVAKNQMRENAREKMSAMALVLREHVNQLENGLESETLVEHVKKIGDETGFRFTLINESGTVVADSKTGGKDIGPHQNRPEIIQALDSGYGFSERTSATLNMPMMYLAVKSDETKKANGYVRVAVPSVSINEAIQSLQRFIFLFIVGLSAVTGILMVAFASRMMQPLSQFADSARAVVSGSYERVPVAQERDDEWGELASAFNQMQTVLAERERGLRENSNRLEAVLSSMIEGVISIDHNGVVQMANSAACRMLSLAQPELVGQKLLGIARFPDLNQAIQQTLTNNTFSKTEFQTVGEPRKVIKAQVSSLIDGEHSGAAIVIHDVTELRRLETMRSDFVANVSHELKTPLASIRAYAETLKMGALDDNEKNQHFVEQIEAQAVVLNQQIQDLIQLARVESAETSFEVVAVDLVQVSQECVRQFAAKATKREIDLQFRSELEAVFAKSDLEAVKTILNNLVSNALHYTSAGGKVTVEVLQDERNTILQVVDTGIGIPLEQQSRVFERFYRVDKARSRDLGGTGLGLSIVKHLSQAFGGNVELTSQIGKGSTFRVELPRHIDDA